MSQHAPCVQIFVDEGAYDSELDRTFERIDEHPHVDQVVHMSRGQYAVCPSAGSPEHILDDIHGHVLGLPVVQSARVVHAC